MTARVLRLFGLFYLTWAKDNSSLEEHILNYILLNWTSQFREKEVYKYYA